MVTVHRERTLPVTARQKEVERLGSLLDPSVRALIDRAIVPALVREFLALEARPKIVAVHSPSVSQCETKVTPSVEGVA
jgi:hypothetical protein